MSVLLVKQRSEPHFGVLRGNVCDTSLVRWKARSLLPIGYKLMIDNFLLVLTAVALYER